jgi:hypothetical protein
MNESSLRRVLHAAEAEPQKRLDSETLMQEQRALEAL